jgi:hypothetical protein
MAREGGGVCDGCNAWSGGCIISGLCYENAEDGFLGFEIFG